MAAKEELREKVEGEWNGQEGGGREGVVVRQDLNTLYLLLVTIKSKPRFHPSDSRSESERGSCEREKVSGGRGRPSDVCVYIEGESKVTAIEYYTEVVREYVCGL